MCNANLNEMYNIYSFSTMSIQLFIDKMIDVSFLATW